LLKQSFPALTARLETVIGAWLSPVGLIVVVPSAILNVKDSWGGDMFVLLVVAVQFPLRLLGWRFAPTPSELWLDPPAQPASRNAKSENRERKRRQGMGSRSLFLPRYREITLNGRCS
jgi:hypothetical protein